MAMIMRTSNTPAIIPPITPQDGPDGLSGTIEDAGIAGEDTGAGTLAAGGNIAAGEMEAGGIMAGGAVAG
jgi:hypothetical protein